MKPGKAIGIVGAVWFSAEALTGNTYWPYAKAFAWIAVVFVVRIAYALWMAHRSMRAESEGHQI